MRIALHATGEIGTRAGKILQAEAGLAALGLFRQPDAAEDRRTTAISDLTGYQVLVGDASGEEAVDLAREGVSSHLHVVLWADVTIPEGVAAAAAAAGRTVLTGASLAAGIAETLAAHEAGTTDAVFIGWTEPGDPMRRGEAIPFPDPIGARWGRIVSDDGRLVRAAAPVAGPWAGAVARVMAATAERVVGVADERAHIEAIALAAGAISVAERGFGPGPCSPVDAAEAYLGAALRVGMGVATFTEP
jgi:hypothetical protein